MYLIRREMKSLPLQLGDVQVAYAVRNHMRMIYYTRGDSGELFLPMYFSQISDIAIDEDGCRIFLKRSVPLFFTNTRMRVERVYEDGWEYDNISVDGKIYNVSESNEVSIDNGFLFGGTTELQGEDYVVNLGDVVEPAFGASYYSMESEVTPSPQQQSELPSCSRASASKQTTFDVYKANISAKQSIPSLASQMTLLQNRKRAAQPSETTPAKRTPARSTDMAARAGPSGVAPARAGPSGTGSGTGGDLVSNLLKFLNDIRIGSTVEVTPQSLPHGTAKFLQSSNAQQVAYSSDGVISYPANFPHVKVFDKITLNASISLRITKLDRNNVQIENGDTATMPIRTAVELLIAYQLVAYWAERPNFNSITG